MIIIIKEITLELYMYVLPDKLLACTLSRLELARIL